MIRKKLIFNKNTAEAKTYVLVMATYLERIIIMDFYLYGNKNILSFTYDLYLSQEIWKYQYCMRSNNIVNNEL